MTSGGRFTDRALSLSKNESRQSSVSGCERPPTAKPSAPPQPTTTPHRPSTTPRRRPTSTDSRRRHRSSCLRLPPASQAPPPQFQGTGGLHLAEVPLRPEGHGEGDGRKVRLQRVQEVVRASIHTYIHTYICRTCTEERSGCSPACGPGSVGHPVCLVQACVKGLYLYLYLS